MQGFRKLLRAFAVLVFAILGCWLFLDAAMNGPGEYQVAIAAAVLVAAIGLVATWFWSPLG